MTGLDRVRKSLGTERFWPSPHPLPAHGYQLIELNARLPLHPGNSNGRCGTGVRGCRTRQVEGAEALTAVAWASSVQSVRRGWAQTHVCAHSYTHACDRWDLVRLWELVSRLGKAVASASDADLELQGQTFGKTRGRLPGRRPVSCNSAWPPTAGAGVAVHSGSARFPARLTPRHKCRPRSLCTSGQLAATPRGWSPRPCEVSSAPEDVVELRNALMIGFPRKGQRPGQTPKEAHRGRSSGSPVQGFCGSYSRSPYLGVDCTIGHGTGLGRQCHALPEARLAQGPTLSLL